MARPRLEQHGFVAANDLILKPRHDRTGCDRLACEQIGGSDQHSHLDPSGGQRTGEGGNQGRRPRVVNSAREDKAHLIGGNSAVNGLAHDSDGLFPEDEAGPGAHVPAAFASLEHKPARAVAKILFEQARRRHVQVGGDPLAFQSGGLVGASAGNERKRRANLPHCGQLLGAKLGRHEAQNAHAPGPSRECYGRLAQQRSNLRLAQECKGQKRQAAPLGHGPRKARHVAYTRHRALEHRKAGTVGHGQGRRFRQRPRSLSSRDSCRDRPLDGLDDPADCHKLAGQLVRQRRVLADRKALPFVPADAIPHRGLPGSAPLLGRVPETGQRV